MHRVTTQNSYQHRIQTVVSFIAENLHCNLDVLQLADMANFSPYHFHRIYRELMCETVNATVRRLRLQQAAHCLISTEQSISTIAKQIGYGSVEAFSRAFSSAYQLSPARYRQARQHDCRLDPPARPPAAASELTMYQVEMLNFGEMRLVGLPHQGDYMKIGNAFEKLFVKANAAGWLDQNTRSMGLYYDDPQSVTLDKLRSAACITSDKAIDDDDYREYLIPAGQYATVLFKGPYAELDQPYSWLFGEWLPNSGYEPRDFPAFEEYINDPKETPPTELLTRIHCLVELS